MKRLLFLMALAASTFSLDAQDVMVRKSGEIESVKVLEVSPSEVNFKKSNNLDGPVFIEKRSNIASINYQNGEVQTFKASYYEGHLEGKKFTHEADLYLGPGWGVGYQLRREFNQYVGWNIVGISYMNDFSSPADVSLINLKLAGIRGYTPSHKWFRGYGDLSLGYSFLYDYGYCSHRFGMDLNLGVQVHRNFAFGIDLIYCTPDPFVYIGARFSYLF